MSKRKWTLFQFGSGDFKGVEDYLNRQAAKGWELEKVGLFLARWKRTERDDLTWCVDLSNPRQDREDREEYLALCADAGWEMVALTNNMYLLKSKQGCCPAPVQTDPEIEKSNYKKYYIKEVVLSVVVLAVYLAIIALLYGAVGTDWGEIFREAKNTWYEYWTVAAAVICGVLMVPAMLWKMFNFFVTLARNRGGEIQAPPVWALWANAVSSTMDLLGLLVVLTGAVLDIALTGHSNTYIFVLLGMYALYGPYKAYTLEKDIFPKERRRYLMLGIVCLLLLAALILLAVFAPFGDWDTYRENEKGLARYEQTEEDPLIRSEDLGIEMEKGSWAKVECSVTPAGKRWMLREYYYGEMKYGVICETYRSFTPGQARWVTQRQLEEMEEQAYEDGLRESAGADLEPVELDWADEAWYGESSMQIQGETNYIYVLVLRMGSQVTRLTAPAPLLTEELLPVVEERLCG